MHLKDESQSALHHALDGTAPIVVLVANDANLAALTQAGADEFLSTDSLEVEIEARFATAVRLAQLKRDLLATQERLSRQIQVDDLTQVLNRRFFFQAAYRECSRARRYQHALSCLMVDVDHFYLYNTTFGYSCGDYILKEVARMLNTCVRDTDLVARFGGSKFVILLTHTDVEGASTVRHKMESLIGGNYFVWHHQRLPVTVSIGESERVPGRTQTLGSNDEAEDTHPLSTREDLAELLEDADSALFVAKKGARYPAFVESNVSMSNAPSTA
jgi:diguanylate cyclase (GGDEF)-like protein